MAVHDVIDTDSFPILDSRLGVEIYSLEKPWSNTIIIIYKKGNYLVDVQFLYEWFPFVSSPGSYAEVIEVYIT